MGSSDDEKNLAPSDSMREKILRAKEGPSRRLSLSV